MLDAIDEGLEAFLRSAVPLGAVDVDVSFEAPERTWSAKLTRPTVNLFLWDIRRNADRAQAGREVVQRNGRMVYREAAPLVELRYYVTAWTSDHGDERALLGGLLRAVLAHGELPRRHLPARWSDDLPTPTLTLPRSGEAQVELFQALEGQLKAGIHLLVVTAVDTGVTIEAGPPATGFEMRSADRTTGATSAPVRRVAGEVLDAAAVGAVVRTPVGTAVVGPDQRFLVRARPGDEVVVETVPPRVVVVPDVGGIQVP